MDYKSRGDVAQIARLYGPGIRSFTMSRRERLLRWVELLQELPGRRLRTLVETEFKPARERDAMRCDGTAISVAFDDPLLRAAGLGGDTYGDAKRFFELSDYQLHEIVCFCHLGCGISAGVAANLLRRYVPDSPRRGLVRRMLERWGSGAAL